MGKEASDRGVQSVEWSGIAGQGWVAAQDLLDRMFKPMEDLLAEEVARSGSERVLDVGCGTGATTLAASRCLGGDGEALGVDLSQVMINAARARHVDPNLTCRFICADAQPYQFAPMSVDLLISRFGVMFFDDPVAAFMNLASAMRPGGAMCSIVWQGPEANPFMTAAETAAEHLLPGVSQRIPDAPGQFGLADCERVHDLLQRSGWRDIDIRPLEVWCAFPASELDLYLSHLGPVGRRLTAMSFPDKAKILEVVRPAFAPYVRDEQVHFLAACWCIRARAGSR